MTKTIVAECLECGHVHEVAMIQGETPWDDYADAPDTCEACGADWADGGPSEASLRASERRQMGISD